MNPEGYNTNKFPTNV